VAVEWDAPGFDLARDAWAAADGGRNVAYAAVAPDGRLTLAPADADAAVEDELLALARKRARASAVDELRLAVDGERELVRRHPFRLEREILAMRRPHERPAPEPEWPPGVAVRSFEPADARAVHTLLDEAYGAWDSDYVPLAHDDWLRSMTGDPEFDPTVWWLAERDGALAGCALHWRSGWLKDLAVRAGERGRGLGAALVAHGVGRFASRGIDVGLKVDATNPTGAIRLYERLGFEVERREAIWALTP
jgi:ribosomal protein S18 acetylase RimI-like enzyme